MKTSIHVLLLLSFLASTTSSLEWPTYENEDSDMSQESYLNKNVDPGEDIDSKDDEMEGDTSERTDGDAMMNKEPTEKEDDSMLSEDEHHEIANSSVQKSKIQSSSKGKASLVSVKEEGSSQVEKNKNVAQKSGVVKKDSDKVEGADKKTEESRNDGKVGHLEDNSGRKESGKVAQKSGVVIKDGEKVEEPGKIGHLEENSHIEDSSTSHTEKSGNVAQKTSVVKKDSEKVEGADKKTEESKNDGKIGHKEGNSHIEESGNVAQKTSVVKKDSEKDEGAPKKTEESKNDGKIGQQEGNSHIEESAKVAQKSGVVKKDSENDEGARKKTEGNQSDGKIGHLENSSHNEESSHIENIANLAQKSGVAKKDGEKVEESGKVAQKSGVVKKDSEKDEGARKKTEGNQSDGKIAHIENSSHNEESSHIENIGNLAQKSGVAKKDGEKVNDAPKKAEESGRVDANRGGGGGEEGREHGSKDEGDIRDQVEQLSEDVGEESGDSEETSGEEGSGDNKDGDGHLGDVTPNVEIGKGNDGEMHGDMEQTSGDESDKKDIADAAEGSANDKKGSMDDGEAIESEQDASKDTNKASGETGDKFRHMEHLRGTKDGLDEADVDYVSSGSHDGSGGELMEFNKDDTIYELTNDKVRKQNVEGLLRDLMPSGVLPSIPEGFEKLSEMSTVSFTYNVDENNEITVTSDVKEPLGLFGGQLTLTDAKMTFNYKNREEKGQRWQFDAQAKWVNGEQVFYVSLESSKHDDHFTLTGDGESLALGDYASMFVTQDSLKHTGMSTYILDKTVLSDVEIYIVFKDDENIVSLVSGKVEVSKGKFSSYKNYIQKFPKKAPVFSILIDFDMTIPLHVLSTVMDNKLSYIPFVRELIDNKGLLKVADGGFGFVASSTDVDKLRLNVFGEGVLENKLGDHISAGVTLMLPLSFDSQNGSEKHDMIVEVSEKQVRFLPSKAEQLGVSKALKTLSEFTRPKITSLGYPDVSKVAVKELVYDLNKLTFTVVGHAAGPFNIIPGMMSMEDSTLEFRQLVPDQFATLALYGQGSTTLGTARLNISVHTDTTNGELVVEGEARNLWTADIGSAFGVTVETDDEIKKILGDNHMLNMNIENARMFTVVKDGMAGLIHFLGSSRPVLWNDPIEVEAVVFHDVHENKKTLTMGYLFDKLPLPYAIDALSFGQFPSPRLLDNSRNTTLVLSPTNSDSVFLNPAMNGMSFRRGLSLVGQFRLPDVCSLNSQCESAAQLLGTEKWYRVQGLVSQGGYTLEGYVDKAFTLAKGLTLTDNLLEFVLADSYSYMSISTALRLHKNNITFRGNINFDNNAVRLRMGSKDIWSHPFPGRFLAFDRLQIDVPFVSGIPMDEFLITGELNFGLPGSLYRIFAPAYLTFKPSAPEKVAFQATLSNITMETITNALNYKSTLPEVLLNSRFPETLVARYTPDDEDNEKLKLYGKLRVLDRTLVCRAEIDGSKRIAATTSHSKYPLILDNGLVMVYADRNRTKLGPRVSFTVAPEKTSFKVVGYATFMGLGTDTEIGVSESGTEFSLVGNLFGLTKTVVSIMSPDGLPEDGPYIASACIPEVIPHVVSRVDYLLSAAADQAQGYMDQASKNFKKANTYHNEALADEHKLKNILNEREADVEIDDRELFVAEERFNRTCREEQCDKTCIGCTAWQKCCGHDVFGNCVSCPGWKACCWHGRSPICQAKNHGCRIMKQLAAENLQTIARRVYKDKQKKEENDKTLLESEYLKGKTQAVLDAARRALNLVNHDSQVGLGAAASIKRFGLQRLVNIQSVCFQTTLKTLATSCVNLRINATFANQPGVRSIPFYGCLNKEMIPKMATHITNFMFPNVPKQNSAADTKARAKLRNRRGSSRSSIYRYVMRGKQEDLDITNEFERQRRDEDQDSMENKPFWVIRKYFQPNSLSMLQQRATVPRSPLKKKWQIPASRKGKCKIYRQLVEICKDMMSTVKLMFKSYKSGIDQYLKRKTELELGLNTTIADLEKEAVETPELKKRLGDIEMNIRTVNAGVSQWKLNSEADQEDQNKVAIQQWVATMEDRIRRLGGEGVDRFLSNLFRAFEGMFLGTDTPKSSAEEVLNTLQVIREISATFHDVFGNNDITLEKANSRAEIVRSQLQHISEKKIFCDK